MDYTALISGQNLKFAFVIDNKKFAYPQGYAYPWLRIADLMDQWINSTSNDPMDKASNGARLGLTRSKNWIKYFQDATNKYLR